MYKLYHFEKGKERIKENGEYVNKIYSIYGESKNALVERFNRTLGDKLELKFSMNGNHKWLKILPEIVNEYNNEIHRELGITPKEAYDNPDKIINKFSYKADNKRNFKIGDKVYIYKWKDLFEKGRKGYWKISEIFKIKKIKEGYPIMYILEDENNEEILGGFYENQLLKVSTTHT